MNWSGLVKRKAQFKAAEKAVEKLWKQHKAKWLVTQEDDLLLPLPLPIAQQDEDSDDEKRKLKEFKDKEKKKMKQIGDEYTKYIKTNPLDSEPPNLFQWWSSQVVTYPCLAQLAYTLLSIPAMSSEVERVFSSTKRLVTADRNALEEDIIEANECLRDWFIKGIFI